VIEQSANQVDRFSASDPLSCIRDDVRRIF
jgi:hypothetical protein